MNGRDAVRGSSCSCSAVSTRAARTNSIQSSCGNPGMSQFSSSVATQSFKSKRVEKKSGCASCCEGLELFMFCCQCQDRSVQIVFNRVVEILG